MILVPLLIFILFSKCFAVIVDDGKCNSYDSNFKMEDVIGSWWLQAVVPLPNRLKRPSMPPPCFGVNFTEADYEGFKYLAGNHLNYTAMSKTIILQRYMMEEKSFDIWSILVKETRGCFRMVLSAKHSEDRDLHVEPKDRMQLHIIEIEPDATSKENRRLLVQLLWGNHIGATVYSNYANVTKDHLKKANEVVTKLRGKQLPLVECVCIDVRPHDERKISNTYLDSIKHSKCIST